MCLKTYPSEMGRMSLALVFAKPVKGTNHL